MKIKFKLQSASGKKKIELALLTIEGHESTMSSEERELQDNELTSIVFTELDQAQLEKIKSLTKAFTNESSRGMDKIPILEESTLAVRKLEETCLDSRYTLRIYIEPIVLIHQTLTPYGNFEFLLDFKHQYDDAPGFLESYVDWRNAICAQFPNLDLMKQFKMEEKLIVKKAELSSCKIALNVRKALQGATLHFGLFDPAENHEIEEEKEKLEEKIKLLKQQKVNI